jgi:tRNA (guanosine-2'-O-)-methyltransferase
MRLTAFLIVYTLKSKGYQIIATTHMIMIVYWRILTLQNRALCSLVQRDGLSEILQRADGFPKIPMVGFTESLNISVSAAIIIIQNLTNRLRKLISIGIYPKRKF